MNELQSLRSCGLLKRNGKVYVKIVKNCTREQLMPIIQGKILEGSIINTDGWKAYDGLILNGYTLIIEFFIQRMNLLVARIMLMA